MSKNKLDMDDLIDKVNNNGENKILFMVYEDRMDLNLKFSTRANSEQSLKLYTFLKFYLKQLEKSLDDCFEDIYFNKEDEVKEDE